MRAIDADALTEIIHGMYAEGDDPSTYHVDAEGDTLIGKFAVVDAIFNMPTIQPDIVRCKDCQYWNKGSCECREHAVNCQDYYVGDIETEAEYFCGYAERREGTT